jgi:electron transfer flavoprotein alpha subunit
MGGVPERDAAALSAFLDDGLSGAGAAAAAGESIIFYEHDRDRDRLARLAPTPDVRLIKAPALNPDLLVGALVEAVRDGSSELLLFAGGSGGIELATRVAGRTGGAALTGALRVELPADAGDAPAPVICRSYVYSGHLIGRFELSARPCCVSIDDGWSDAPAAPATGHRIVSDTVAAADTDGEAAATAPPFQDVELVVGPATGDLVNARLLVVAGRGAGSRQGVERIAEAAQRMGAAFGVTRPVAMNAWAPMDRLIGVSGARTAPALCLVAGASGAPAFFWGIEQAGVIVAVDLDDQAPILRNADAVILDDAVAVLEELAEFIAAEKGPRPT